MSDGVRWLVDRTETFPSSWGPPGEDSPCWWGCCGGLGGEVRDILQRGSCSLAEMDRAWRGYMMPCPGPRGARRRDGNVTRVNTRESWSTLEIAARTRAWTLHVLFRPQVQSLLYTCVDARGVSN